MVTAYKCVFILSPDANTLNIHCIFFKALRCFCTLFGSKFYPGCLFLFKGDALWKHKRQENHGCFNYMYKSHLCDLCGKSLKTLMSFKEHKLSCEANLEGSYKFTCEHCGTLFRTKSNYQNHVRNVHQTRPMTCHICGQMCKNARSLLEHKRRHDDSNRKHACKDCGKTFFSKSLLTAHVRTHTKEKPFRCAFCSYGCAVKQNLSKHAKKRHKHLSEHACKDYNIIMKPMGSSEVTILSNEPSISQTTYMQNDVTFGSAASDDHLRAELHQNNTKPSHIPVETFQKNVQPAAFPCNNPSSRIPNVLNDVINPMITLYPAPSFSTYSNITNDVYSIPQPSNSLPVLPSHSMSVVGENSHDWSSGDKLQHEKIETQGRMELDLRINRDLYQDTQYLNKSVATPVTSGAMLSELTKTVESGFSRIQQM